MNTTNATELLAALGVTMGTVKTAAATQPPAAQPPVQTKTAEEAPNNEKEKEKEKDDDDKKKESQAKEAQAKEAQAKEFEAKVAAAVETKLAAAVEAELAKKIANSVLYDESIIKTAEQKWFVQQGVLIPDQKLAHVMYQQECAKFAQAQQLAQQAQMKQAQAMGHQQYLTMTAHHLASQMATKQASVDAVRAACAADGLSFDYVSRLAQQKLAAMDGAGVMMGANMYPDAGRPSGQWQQAVEQTAETVDFVPGDTPAGGSTSVPPTMTGFTVPTTLPNNPGLNHGQPLAAPKT